MDSGSNILNGFSAKLNSNSSYCEIICSGSFSIVHWLILLSPYLTFILSKIWMPILAGKF